MKNFAIIGSGVSGIACAYYLKKIGYQFDIIESDKTIGGRVCQSTLDGKPIDIGGKNIGYQYKLLREFIEDQGKYEYEYFGVNTSKIINNKIIPLNREKTFKSFTNLFRLASIPDLIKLFKYVKRIKKNPDEGFLNTHYYNNLSNKLDKETLSKYFSKKCVNNIIRPMTIRMNGAEPEECYIGNFGSNLRSAFDKYEQITTGIYPILKNFCDKENIILNTEVLNIELVNNKIKLTINSSKKKEILYYDHVIISTPANVTKNLLEKILPKTNKIFNQIKYFPVAVAVAKYKEPVFNSEIRALVFEKDKPISNAGAYGINDLNIVRYTFSGKIFRKYFDKKLTSKKAINLAEKLMPKELNIKNNHIIDYTYHYWKYGLCAYSQFHHKNLQLIKKELEKINKITLAGDYISGASIEACFKSAKKAIKDIHEKN